MNPAHENLPALDSLLSALVTPEIIYFPIRHHSPACAWHIESLIRTRKPRAVLVEGPAAFTSLIPLILHEKTRAPVAVYTSFVGEKVELPPEMPKELADLLGPPRHAAYYPFCDYSPELVALRAGKAVGAGLRFIDLDYPEQINVERQDAEEDDAAPRVESLLEERHFKRSRFIQNLARRAGCRDHNDLWDHFFETRLDSTQSSSALTEKFIRDVTAWCYYARADASTEELDADGTRAREEAMAASIREVLSNAPRDGTRPTVGPVLVVTGGFHTVALPGLVAAEKNSGRQKDKPKGELLTCLVRYSFEQLDALNGYAAGMPSPYYYDQIWRGAKSESVEPARANKASGPTFDPFTELAAKVLVQLGQTTRKKKMAAALSPADEIAALDQARRLAALRGHPGPMREDLLDGVRSCFVKGSMDAEGAVLLGLARHTLGGTSIGEVPAEAGVPPLVENFRITAKLLRFNIDDSVRKKASFDLYRKRAHRKASRFLHCLSFLEVPFGSMIAGPDFVQGVALERLHEHWDYQWSPQTESQLVEASIYGATVEEAAANRLVRTVAELEMQGRGRSAAEAVSMLVHACRMGLHRYTDRLRSLIAAQAAEDPDFKSLASALNQLILLWESREPLEAHKLAEIPELIRAAYGRACFLLHDLMNSPADGASDTLNALVVVRDVLQTSACSKELLDSALFFEPLPELIRHPKTPPLLAGAACGILHSGGRMSDVEVLQALAGFLNASSTEAGGQIAFVIGLLRTCREIAWQQPAFAEAIHKLLATWSEDEFVERLPHLRMAFADLTPRETDQVAEVVAKFHGGEKPARVLRPEFSEAEMLAAVRLNNSVMRALKEDGLEGWV